MQKQGKSRKPLIVGIIAAVVILAALLVVLLTQCTGGQGEASTPTTEDISSQEYQLYWNLDKADYAGKSEAGLSSRMPEEDGFFYVRFLYEGEIVTLKVADRRTINSIDVQDLMGLEFDENDVVVGVKKLDDLPLEKAGWQFFVQSAGRGIIKLNSSESLNGMEILLEGVDANRVWDVSGVSGEKGVVDEPITYDKVMAVQNLEGKTTHVFIYERPNYMASHTAYCEHCGKDVEWLEWTKTNTVPSQTGHYQLQNDIANEGGQVSLADETRLCLDLNGYRIDGKKNGRMYRNQGVAIEFALMDTSEAKTGVIAGHGKSDQGGLIWVTKGAFYMYGGTLDGSDMTTEKFAPVMAISKDAYFYMYDGHIIGGTAKPTYNKETGKYSGGYAGAIQCQGKFVMHDGIIEGGRAKAKVTYKDGNPTYNAGYGGNLVFSSGAVFEMNGGIIRNGKSDGTGGNIYTSAACEITMNGGSIQGGICYGKGKNGGNIYLGKEGSVFTFNGGSIVGGVSYNAAGNVYCAGQFIMNSGYIGSGALMKFGKNERSTGTSYNMMVVNGKLTLWGGTIVGGVSIQDSKADQKYQAQLNIYGTAKVHGDETGRNLTISKNGDGVTVNVGTMQKGADIYVNASGIFTKPTKQSNMQYFHSDVEGVDVTYFQECLAMGKASCICGASKTENPDAHDLGCDGEVLFWGPWTDAAALPTATGNYFLVKDVTSTGQTTVGAGQDIKLDLNGYNATLQVKTSAYDGFRLYRVDDGSKLAITDTQAKLTGSVGTLKTVMPAADAVYTGSSFTVGGVTYEGQAAKDKAKEIWEKNGNFGMLLWARGGYITIHNGLFDGSNLTATNTGMIWHIASHSVTDAETGEKTTYYGSVTMYNGRVICGNLTSGDGAIDAASKCELNVYGGIIENGVEESPVKTRIYVASSGKLLLAGGNVDGGITVAGNVTLSGAPIVGKEDGGLVATKAIAINGTLRSGASVYTSKTGYITDETDAANQNFIHSTIDGLDVIHLDNKLFAGKMGCLCNYGKTVNGTQVTAHSAGCIAAMTHMGLNAESDKLQMSALTKDLYTGTVLGAGGNWYLTDNMEVGSATKQDAPIIYIANGSTLVIDLNGKTLKLNRSGMAFSTQNSNKETHACTLIITDTSAEQNGKIELNGWSYQNSDGTWTANQGGIIRLWGRTANSAKEGGYEYANNTVYLLAGTLDASNYILGNNEVPNGFAGAVHVHHHQTMHMYGGTIIGSNSPYVTYSSAVDVTSSSTFNMYGGMIYGGNKADVSVLNNTGRFTMSGGIICGGVNTTTSVMKVTGTAVINKELTPAGIVKPAYSLKISSEKALSFAGLTTGAEVYVTAGGKFGTNADASIAALVKADNPTGKVELDGTDLVMGYADLTYCECGGTLNNKYGHVCENVQWTAWTSGNSLPITEGNYYLTTNVTMGANVTVPKNVTIRLDLKGYKITLNSGINLYKFSANGKSTVVITDTANGEGIIATGTGGNGGIMDVGTENTVKVYNVILDGSARTLTENGGVAAVRAGAHLITYNVTMKGGYAKGTWNGTSGNKKDAGVFRLFASSGSLAAGQLTVYGGTIYGGKATNNGGILYCNSNNVIYMEDVSMVGGEAAASGGALQIAGGTLTLKNCSITGAKSRSNGAVYMSGSSTRITISGNTTIEGNTTADGMNASNVYVAGGLLVVANDFTGKISLAGRTDAALFENVATLNSKYIADGNIVLDDAANYRFKLYSDKLGIEEIPPEPRTQCICGGVLAGTEGHTCVAVEFQPWTSTNSLPTAAGNYYLNKNVGLTAAATIAADVNIDLNGKTVSNASGTVLNITAGTVTITDSTATAGTISGGAGSVIKASGSAIVNLYAGNVTGGKANNGGGASLTGSSKLNLAGAVKIVDNKTADGSAANNVFADGGTMSFLPGFSGKVGIAGAYEKLVVTGITSESDALLTSGKVALDDQSGNFKLVASAEGLTYGLANASLKYACVCGGTMNGQYGHTCEKIFWEPWTASDSLPTATGNYYLTANSVTLSAAGTVAKNATVRLDLNGKTVNLNDNVQLYKFGADYASKLVITDTTAAPGSVIAVGGAGNGGIMDVNTINEVEVYNVTLDASQRTIRENGAVAAIRADSSLTTYKAIIKGGTAGPNAKLETKDGGCFRIFTPASGTSYKKDGKLTVYGGTVYGGTATNRGSVVYAANNGDIDFTDVNIIGGNSGAAGGAFYITGTTKLDLNNVTISKMTAGTYGGAFYIAGTAEVNMTGGSITETTATGDYGGAIYVAGEGKMNLQNVTISKCSAKSYGGAVYIRADGEVNMTGCTVEECSTNNAGGAFYLIWNTDEKDAAKKQAQRPTLVMNNSTVQKCTTKNAAGAIYMYYGAQVTLNSVNITECVSGTGGGAIRLQDISGDASLTVGGNTTIINNKKGTAQDNLFFNQAVPITLASDFTGKIGLANEKTSGVIPSITSLTDSRVGDKVVLDNPDKYEFTIIGGILGVKIK